ncbi:MAG: hypothetical protein KBC33_03760 [Candidatus Pacebacteria bacterium]|nr:hypothetical protein [Candidatus Paceibacterota bacterium]
MSNQVPDIEITVLSISVGNQHDQYQNLVKITVSDRVPDDFVTLYIDKAKSFVACLAMLSILSDPALLSFPQVISPEEDADEDKERSQIGGVLVATEVATDDAPERYVKFTGSHRIWYATADRYHVHGGMIDIFKKQLACIAKFHPWITVS